MSDHVPIYWQGQLVNMARRSVRVYQRLAAALVGSTLALLASAGVGRTPAGLASPTVSLRDSGLYADFADRRIDPQYLGYAPQYPLWSDGAVKRRWVHLPPGHPIDASNLDQWVFPIGTKVWKEFAFGGRPVETRLIERLADGDWLFASYVWNADLTDAVLAPAEGLRGVFEIRPGVWHDIPGVLDCQVCHVTDRVEILGFSALQLSTERDPGDPHAEVVAPGMVDLLMLIGRDLIQSYPPRLAERPPRIDARSPTERAALGYLHANCGNCHNANSSIESVGLILRHSIAPTASGELALRTAVDRIGRYRIPGAAQAETYHIRPGDPAHSAVLARMNTRNPFHQMPPLGTKIVDAEAVELIRNWILEGLPEMADRPSAEGDDNTNPLNKERP
jgi:hypothetical protein